MENKSQLQQKIIEVFDSQFAGKLPTENGSVLFTGDGFMPLLLNVIHESPEIQLISMGHYYEHNQIPQPDPYMHFRIHRGYGTVTPLAYCNSVYTTRTTANAPFPPQESKDLNEFLLQWLRNIIMQGYSPSGMELEWKRQPQEIENDYTFSGRFTVTQGIVATLNPAEIFSIWLDLEGFVLSKGSIDYLQIFKKENASETIYCIDQLSESMKQEEYTPEEVKQYDYFTMLLASEY